MDISFHLSLFSMPFRRFGNKIYLYIAVFQILKPISYLPKYPFDMFRNFEFSELCVNLPRNRQKHEHL